MSVQDADQGHIVTASCLTARGAGGLNLDPETSNLIPAIPFDLAQITSATNRSKAEEGMPAPTMSKSSHMHVAFPIDTQNMSPGHNSGGLGFGDKDDPSFTLTKGHSHAVAYAIQERAVCENPKAGPDGAGFRDDDAAYTLEARSVTQAVAYSIMPMNSGKDFKARETDVAQPLMAAGPVGGNQGGDFVAASAVRRLTPVECERLQGFPDNFTLIPWRGKAPEDCPDGPRYKALGNSMAVPVMRWIGERIMKVEGLLND
jgi:site-specific DNA-cytosine methylase